MRRRVLAGLADQALSSGSNAIVLIAFARTAPKEAFGQITFTFVLIALVLSVARGFIGTRLAGLSGRENELSDESRRSFGLSLWMALVLVLAAAALSGTPLAPETKVLASGLGIVVVQDVLRYVAIARGEPEAALLSDGAWFLGSVLALTASVVQPTTTPAGLAAIWIGAASVALALIALRLKVRPVVRGLIPWLRRGARERFSFGIEGVISPANGAVITALVTATLGLGATAALRGAGTLMGPLSLLLGALPLIATPELARRQDRSGRAMWRAMRPVTAALSLLALCVGALSLVPDAAGEAILGDSWSGARRVIPIMALEYAFLTWMFAASVGLRVIYAGRVLLRVRLFYSATAIAVALVSTKFGDVIYVAAGQALVGCIFAIVARRTLVSRGHPSTPLGP